MRAPAMRGFKAAPIKEVSLHMTVAALIRRAWPEHLPWWHTPNGEQRDKRVAGKLKGMGVLAGVPDLIFIMPNGQASFIELKRKGEGLSADQLVVHDKLRALGCAYETCRTPEEVEDVLERWLGAFGLTLRCRIIRPRAA
jgi:hypothetical protein